MSRIHLSTSTNQDLTFGFRPPEYLEGSSSFNWPIPIIAPELVPALPVVGVADVYSKSAVKERYEGQSSSSRPYYQIESSH